GSGFGDPVLDGLLLGEQPAERLSLERARTHQLEGALHLPQPAHDVVDATRPEALLRDPETVARLAERVRERDANAGEPRFAVRSPATALVAHDGDPAHELVAGRLRRDEAHRRPPASGA